MKNIFYISLISILVLGLSGCTNYLDEESYRPTMAVFETEEGSESLIHILYTKVNNCYGGAFGFGYFTENGTDIWLRGNNSGATGLADFRNLDAFHGTVATYWNHFYKALWDTNLYLELYPNIVYKDEAKKQARKAEVLTLQSLYLWVVTESWGDSYLPTSTNDQEGLEARRSTREDFYKKIIANLEEAIPLLPKKTEEIGRVNQGIAKAFLARMYLYHQEWDKAIALSTDVIENYGYELAPSWDALWDEKKSNKEFIWTTEFSLDKGFGGGSSIWWKSFAMFIDRFAGVKTELNYTGFGGCQMLPSTFYLSLFDKKADLRWKQGHQWVWVYNDPEDDTSMFPEMKTLYKDTALYLHPGVLTASERAYMKNRYTVFDMNDMYDSKGIPKDRWTFIGMTKFDDHTRPDAMSPLSSRNYPVIRLGEIYLIRSECYMRTGNLSAAAADINTLRERVIAPGYENEMKVSPEDVDLDFILNERGRELAGEFQRWFDLKRTGTTLARVKAHNPDAAPYIKDFHLLRPIPQAQFDGMPDPKTLGQNPGY